jgi:hypothetical protein
LDGVTEGARLQDLDLCPEVARVLCGPETSGEVLARGIRPVADDE